MENKSLIIRKPLNEDIIDQRIPGITDNEILIKVKTSGICGTDIHIYEGNYMGEYPVIPGHEFSGIVEQIGPKVTRIKKGDHVAIEPNIACNNCTFCLQNEQNFCKNWQAIGVTLPGGMAGFVKAPEPAVFSIEDLSFDEGAFMEPLSCVLHGIEKLNLMSGQDAMVIGAGPIGLLLFQVLKINGCTNMYIVEKDKKRAEYAQQFGAHNICYNLSSIQNKSFDIVIDASGVVSLMKQTIDFARQGGQILLFGVPPMGDKMELDAFHIFRKGLTIMSSFTSTRNSLQALSLLKSGLINVKDLITHRLCLEEFTKGIKLVKDKKELTMKVMIIPELTCG